MLLGFMLVSVVAAGVLTVAAFVFAEISILTALLVYSGTGVALFLLLSGVSYLYCAGVKRAEGGLPAQQTSSGQGRKTHQETV